MAGLKSKAFWGGPYFSLIQFSRFEGYVQKAGLSIEGKRILDLGCGLSKPFSNAVLFYLLGASEIVAVDVQDYSRSKGSAFRLYALLLCIAADETVLTRRSQKQRETVYSRLSHFSMAALRKGDMAGGLPSGIRHVVGDYRKLSLHDASFDICVSFSVFEHINELETVLASLHKNMNEGGAIFADIDYRDHRLYFEQASPWQYIIDDGDQSPNYINKLRHSAMLNVIRSAGFRLDEVSINKSDPPTAVITQIHPNHRHWDKEDLSIVDAQVLFRK